MHQDIGLFARNAWNRSQRFNRFGDLLFKTLGNNDFGLDVHLPPGQFRGKSRILAALADGQGQLIGADDNLDPLIGLIDLEGLQFGGCQRVGNEVPNNWITADDVYLLVVELADDVLDALTSQTDTRPD